MSTFAQGPAARYDTRTLLANAAKQALDRNLADIFIVDADAHHYETESWAEITEYIEEPVIRLLSQANLAKGGPSDLILNQPANQDVSGRISRYQGRRREPGEPGVPRDVTLVRHSMEMMAVDVTVLFPTPMLILSLHPQVEIEVALARAYARWLTERILPADRRIKTLLYLPFNDPDQSLRMVQDFGDLPGVVGFMVTTVRHRPVHDNAYMKVYAALQERRLPLGFHSAWDWTEPAIAQLNRFLSVHAVGRPLYNIVHLTNWVINGLPERFPGLKVLWIEGGLAWIPFLMQRLDMEYVMRSSEAPLLKRKPSEYIREMYFTQQPMEVPDDPAVLETTFKLIGAETQLLYASDYPHWNFDLPSVIYDLPFLSDAAKRRILGENARQLFQLDRR